MVEHLKKDVLAVSMKTAEQVGALTASLEQTGNNGEELKRESESVTREMDTLSKKRKFVEHERDGLQAKLRRANCDLDRHADAFNRVQSSAGDLQELLAKCENDRHANLVVEFL